MLNVSEIFFSVQGEGVLQGVPTVFVRLAGCNLLVHCSYCDTSYAWDSEQGTKMFVEDILQEVLKLKSRIYRSWICITGGEPLLQSEELHALVKGLKSFGCRISIETNGTIKKPSWWTLVDSWVFDIKGPSSDLCGLSLVEDWFESRTSDQAKLVVGTKLDLDFARHIIMKNATKNPIMLVSPMAFKISIPNDAWDEDNRKLSTGYTSWDEDWMQEVVEFCKEMNVRFSLQIHKVVYGNKKGV